MGLANKINSKKEKEKEMQTRQLSTPEFMEMSQTEHEHLISGGEQCQ
jgi:hypothetical protein